MLVLDERTQEYNSKIGEAMRNSKSEMKLLFYKKDRKKHW